MLVVIAAAKRYSTSIRERGAIRDQIPDLKARRLALNGRRLFHHADRDLTLTVMCAAEPVVAAWLAIANMDIHRRMFVRQLANVPGEGMAATVIGAVNEPDRAEISGAAALLGDVRGHRDHRRDADPPKIKTTGSSLARVRVNLPRGVIASMRKPGFPFAWR